MQRRSIVSRTKVFLLFVIAIALTMASFSTFAQQQSVSIETKTLEELYQDAIEEGGELVVWAGGDSEEQIQWLRDAFAQSFPEIDAKIEVDVSKFLGARIDNQLDRGELEVDVAQLQTLHDFEYWKEQGQLLNYKPQGWEQVYPQFKDQDGAYTGIFVVAFSTIINTNLITDTETAPRDAEDFLDPQYKGKLILTYPHDDDAVLYQFYNIIKKYGWEYLDKLLEQEPTWVRGTAKPYVGVLMGDYAATFTAADALVPFPGSTTHFLLPKNDFFLSWAQTAAVFKDAKHPAAAKLYLNWLLSKQFQENWIMWPIREDVEAAGGYGAIFDHNTDPVNFRDFMQDRAKVERFRAQIEQVIGPVLGPPPLEQ